MPHFIALNMVEAGRSVYNEETGRDEVQESNKPVCVNADNIRAFYRRRDGKPGTRITFSDGGGFAVTESPDEVAGMVAGGELAARLAFAVTPAANETAS